MHDPHAPRAAWHPHERHTCRGCGVQEGALHAYLNCDGERCPYCGRQLSTCMCCYKQLHLIDRTRYGPETEFLPPEIYEGGLTEAQQAAWQAMLHAKGRVPYIVYPNLCARCGMLWPDMFMVADHEWRHYVQKDSREVMLCRTCYLMIAAWIDTYSRKEPPDAD